MKSNIVMLILVLSFFAGSVDAEGEEDLREQPKKWSQEYSEITDASDENLFLKVQVEEPAGAPEGSVLLKYNLYTRYDTRYDGFQNGGSFPGFRAELTTPSATPDKEVVEVDGREFVKVTLRELTLFPIESGNHIIDPGIMKLQIVKDNTKKKKIVYLVTEPVEIVTE